jgi:hypothetical protein
MSKIATPEFVWQAKSELRNILNRQKARNGQSAGRRQSDSFLPSFRVSKKGF